MKILICSLISVLLFSCGTRVETATYYKAYIKNTSSHSILISPFSMGNIRQDLVIVLGPDSSKRIANGYDDGIVPVGFGFSAELSVADSIWITFDNSFRMVHYTFTPAQLSPRYYLYDSTRNLLNIKSWEGEIIGEGKYYRKIDYSYLITEQDYLDAK